MPCMMEKRVVSGRRASYCTCEAWTSSYFAFSKGTGLQFFVRSCMLVREMLCDSSIGSFETGLEL